MRFWFLGLAATLVACDPAPGLIAAGRAWVGAYSAQAVTAAPQDPAAVAGSDALVARLRPVPYPALVFLYTHSEGWLRADLNRARLENKQMTAIGVGVVRSLNGYVDGTLILTR